MFRVRKQKGAVLQCLVAKKSRELGVESQLGSNTSPNRHRGHLKHVVFHISLLLLKVTDEDTKEIF